MDFNVQQFYRQLDESYASLDRNATEAFLLVSKETACQTSERQSTPASASITQTSPNAGLVAVCNELGCFYRGLSRWQASLDAFTQALQELERFHQTDTVQYATILLNEAGAYRYMRQNQQALELFQKAERILVCQPNPPANVLAGLYNNTGLVLLDLNRPADALPRFKQALSIISSLNESLAEQGSSWNNLAAAYNALGHTSEALDAMNHSAAIFATLDHGRNPHYAAALNTRGICHYQQGDYQSSLSDFTAALEITNLVYGENIEYACGCDNCAAAYQRLGENSAAQRWAAKAAAIRERLGSV